MEEKTEETRQLKIFKPTKKGEEGLKKKTKSRSDGRWVVFFLFLATVLACLFFYLRTEVSVWLREIFGPELVIP